MWIDLNNASVGALVGAAGAFLLVVLTDWRRDRKIATKVLPAQLRRLLTLIDSRLQGAENARQAVSVQNPLMRNSGLEFPISRIQKYAEKGIDSLSDRQFMALDNLTFWMRESDRLNREAITKIDEIEIAQRDFRRGEENMRLGIPSLEGALRVKYGEEIVLLKNIRDLIDAYLAA